ncbi:hypothetical protein EHI8A_037210 [Entamoeba histolytica HM-1:IMSS-B]|uniref:BRO1 domain-containing protein n=6 Tax=Entamoeba histolytica TaxID=5759 RepID=C4M203_ENTH1|nr:hypothetical protein EHI_165220 [Entamoeba histolytica HM-1:IMSS]EMD42412.1 Hypothetical protein EHI5A_069550 [Entamoeba histolytica KU27]EMH77756.1 hypothetical protein EHI8A_037210 [Entamoeba histolytica HM-1:IMSS-B]EMS12353.1 hypothetical protein KM1_080580 [Entamoeba histolytica HM-3:IMSS]ENY60119.1 hypothetical protein EHI7A_038220 [Entamoeba histolytica HM-1:IMSS-A]GAT95277.1 hypothetical protein CL6EHI_165220 [Entamoeba histolytica]|eukprot:XP_652232.2 hypothetical protein EHI_165220 [Entamoeba histolytica HM-1:IMSS]
MTQLFDLISFPPLKLKDTTNVPIYQALTRVISSQFGTVYPSIQPSLKLIENLRDKLVNSNNPEIIIKSGTDYYNYLNLLVHRIDLNSNPLQITFKWSDTFKKDNSSSSSSLIYFELANVLYNVAVSHILLCISLFKIQIQPAINHLKSAAYIFNEILKVISGNEKQITLLDIHPDVLKTLNQFCILSIQYLFYQKSKQENKTQTTQLKLGAGVYRLSLLVHESLKISKEFFSRPIYAVICMFLRIVVSEVQLQISSHNAKEELKYGEQIARTMIVINDLESISHLKELPKEYKGSCDNIIKSLKADLAQYEKDNNEIYFQNIPEPNELEYPEATILAKPNPISQIENNPFKELLPLKIRTSFSNYIIKAKQVIDDTKKISPAATKTGNDYLARIKLNELIQVITSPDIVPSDIEKFIKEFSETKQYSKLKESLDIIKQTTEKNDNMIKEIRQRFDEEALKDQDGIMKYRNYWNIPLVSNQQDKINRIREIDNFITTSKRNDIDSITKMKLNDEMLSLFEQGVNELIKFFPTKEEKETVLPIIKTLEEEKSEWENIINDREELLQLILNSAMIQESELIDELNSSDNQAGVVEKYTKKLVALTSQMQQSFDNQQTLLKSIDKNKSEIQIILGSKAIELNTNINKIYNAMKVVGELRDEIAQSMSYHAFILSKITTLQNDIFTFCDKHSFEVQDLLRRLESAKIKPLSNSAPQFQFNTQKPLPPPPAKPSLSLSSQQEFNTQKPLPTPLPKSVSSVGYANGYPPQPSLYSSSQQYPPSQYTNLNSSCGTTNGRSIQQPNVVYSSYQSTQNPYVMNHPTTPYTQNNYPIQQPYYRQPSQGYPPQQINQPNYSAPGYSAQTATGYPVQPNAYLINRNTVLNPYQTTPQMQQQSMYSSQKYYH